MWSAFGCAIAQVAPPAMGGRHFGSWVALALRQSLDSLAKRRIIVYAGNGRISVPGGANPLARQGIFVTNAEYFHRLHPKHQFSIAFSHRFQNEYRDPPAGSGQSSLRQEYRLYGRWFFDLFNDRRAQLSLALRHEWRLFVSPSFVFEREVFQPRWRIRAEAAAHLDSKLKHRFSFRVEQLFAASFFADRPPTKFAYRETRVSAFYSCQLPKAILSFGVLQLVNAGRPPTGVNLGMDLTLRDPFGVKAHPRPKPARKDGEWQAPE
ncbi:MAG: hypothetical protein RMM53_05200 [Bacteroidia bacterium]|nr:hypothetical protein [Bacteroidia bacterium]